MKHLTDRGLTERWQGARTTWSMERGRSSRRRTTRWGWRTSMVHRSKEGRSPSQSQSLSSRKVKTWPEPAIVPSPTTSCRFHRSLSHTALHRGVKLEGGCCLLPRVRPLVRLPSPDGQDSAIRGGNASGVPHIMHKSTRTTKLLSESVAPPTLAYEWLPLRVRCQ